MIVVNTLGDKIDYTFYSLFLRVEPVILTSKNLSILSIF